MPPVQESSVGSALLSDDRLKPRPLCLCSVSLLPVILRNYAVVDLWLWCELIRGQRRHGESQKSLVGEGENAVTWLSHVAHRLTRQLLSRALDVLRSHMHNVGNPDSYFD